MTAGPRGILPMTCSAMRVLSTLLVRSRLWVEIPWATNTSHPREAPVLFARISGRALLPTFPKGARMDVGNYECPDGISTLSAE